MQNGFNSAFKEFNVSSVSGSRFVIGNNHNIQNGEKVILISDDANYPENIIPHKIYYAITLNAPYADAIQLASTKTDADNKEFITVYGGNKLRIISRVSDKNSGDPGHPIQWDSNVNRWYLTTNTNSEIYTYLNLLGVSGVGKEETEPSFVVRKPDSRSLDEKIYKFRYVIPKELFNGKSPEPGFIIQESSTTSFRDNNDFNLSSITNKDYDYKRNPRFISNCTNLLTTTTVTTELPHNLHVDDQVIIKGVSDSNNTSAADDAGYNGTFIVTSVSSNNMEFTYTNLNSIQPGVFVNNTSSRTIALPRYQRNDLKSNFYIYRSEVIDEYIENQQDGVYNLYALRSDIAIQNEFTNLKYSQNVTDFYPQLDRDNIDDNPPPAYSFAKSSPIGDVDTSDLKGSITRETCNRIISKFVNDLTISSSTALVGNASTITFARNHGFNGIVGGTLIAGTGTRNNGTYYNVKLYNDNLFTSWDGATAKVVVELNVISSFEILSSGSGYNDGDVVYFDISDIGGNPDEL